MLLPKAGSEEGVRSQETGGQLYPPTLRIVRQSVYFETE